MLIWGDVVVVERFFFWYFDFLSDGFFMGCFSFESCLEMLCMLLVYFCLRGYVIDGYEEELFWFDFVEEMFNVVEYMNKYFFFI